MNSIFFHAATILPGIIMNLCYFNLLELFLKLRPFKKSAKYIYILAVPLISIWIYIYLPLQWRWGVNGVIQFLPPLLFFHGRLTIKALLFLLRQCMMLLGEMIGAAFLGALGWEIRLTDAAMLSFTLEVFLAFVSILLVRLVRSARSVLQEGLDRRTLLWLMGCAGVVGLAVMHIYFSLDVQYVPDDTGHMNILRRLIRGDLAGLLVNLLLFIGLPYLLLCIVRRMEERARETREAALSLRRAQYELLGYQDAIASEARMRRFRHDMRNHLAALQAMNRSGDREREAAYIREMLDAFTEDGTDEKGARA